MDPEFEGEFRWRDFKELIMVYVDRDDVKFALYDLVTLVAENAEMQEEQERAFAIRDEPRRLRELEMRKEDARSWKVRELWKETNTREGLAAEDQRAREFRELNLMNAEDRRSREWVVMYGFDHVFRNPDWWYVTVPVEEEIAADAADAAEAQWEGQGNGWEQYANDDGGYADSAYYYDENGAAYETKTEADYGHYGDGAGAGYDDY